MIKITRYFYINILCIPLFVIAYFTGSIYTLICAYCVVAVHEIFHLLAALALRIRVGSIIVMPFGITLRLQSSIIKSPSKEIILAVAGPLANLLMVIIAKVMQSLYIWSDASIFLFVYLNYITMFINFLPCMPLDGGRVLRAILVGRIGYINTVYVQKKISRAIIFILCIFGLLLIVITRCNISLVMIAAFLAFNMIDEARVNEYVIMREILYSEDKLKKRGIMRTKILAADENISAGSILKELGYDSFYIINVVDDNLSVCGTITEGELIKALHIKGYNESLGLIVREMN